MLPMKKLMICIVIIFLGMIFINANCHVNDCSLEWWSFEFLTLLSGLLPNPELEASVLSVWYVPISISPGTI